MIGLRSLFLTGVLALGHDTLDVEAYDLRIGVGVYGDGLAEMSGHLTLAAVGDIDGACLARADRCLGEFRHGASTGCYGLIDDERCVAGVGEGEDTLLDGVVLGEGAEITLPAFEGDHGLCHTRHCHDEKCKKNKCFFHLVYDVQINVFMFR